MSSSKVRAGQVYVEIGADPRKFFAALGKLNKAVGTMGRSLSMSGAALTGIGAGMAAPIVAAVAAGARFEDRLLAIKASTGATQGELDRVKSAAMGMSEALGVGPTEAAAGMLELLKAGMSLDAVLGGAGKAALEFAKVGEMDVGQAAVVMSDAMNVFGISGEKAANTLSSAADASSTSIAQMSEAFSMSSAVAALANQSIDDLSAALAILANNGVKGSDAGTSVKTMLMRLMAPADEAIGAFAQLGLSVDAFRGADGKMKPMVEIIRTLNGALAGMDQAAKDDIFRRIFGADAIRAASILTSAGAEGFANMQASMASALPVGEKYKAMMSGLSGAMGNIMASLERMSIAISDAVAPALASVIPFVEGLARSLVDFVTNNKEAVAQFAKLAVATIAVGGVLTGLGLSLQVASFAFGGILKACSIVAAPLNAVASLAMFIGTSFYNAIAGVVAFSAQSVASAVATGAAWAVANAPLLAMIGLLGAVAAVAITAAGGFSGIASAIGSGFSAAVSDGAVVLSDLASTATTTFNGIYEAIADGDLAGAMDILWAGLVAGWLRGVEAIMSYVDPWTTAFQDVFGRIGSEIYIIWDKLYTDSAAILNTMGAWITGFFDNIANGIMATFDNLVAAIQIAWTRVQGFITGAKDTEERVQAIKDENAARAEQRMQERPGIEGRTAEAARQNADAENQRKDRERAVVEGAAADREARQAENRRRSDQRRADTQAAESTVAGKGKGKREARARNDQFARLLSDIEGASSIDQLRDLYGEFDALSANGRLSSVQSSTIEAALDDAQERITKNLVNAQSASAQSSAQAGADAAGQDAARSKSEVAGTFSSMALGGMGFGSSLAERTLKAAERTAAATEQIAAEGGPRAAE
jgi:TP901 family phage tail tape measure protein